MIAWLLATRLGRAVSGAVVALLVFVGVYTAGKREGAQKARQRMKEKDHERADQIRRRAADADGHSVRDDDVYRD